MKNKKPIIALGALAVVGLVAGTIAYFTSQATFDNEFKTATYKTKTTEVFESPQNWTPGTTTPKTITTKNEGTIPVAVRVSYTESWKNTDTGAAISNPPANAVTINLANTTDWIYDATQYGDYFYYKVAIDPDQQTSTFMSGVTLNPNLPATSTCEETTDTVNHTITKTCTTSLDGLGKATYTLTITVETVQYDHYQDVWDTDGAGTTVVVPTIGAPVHS